jgi:hypothetical protein
MRIELKPMDSAAEFVLPPIPMVKSCLSELLVTWLCSKTLLHFETVNSNVEL